MDTGYTVKRLLNDNMQNNLHSDTLEESHTRGMGSTPHHSRHTTHHSTPCRTFLCFILCYLLYNFCEGTYSVVPWISVVLTFHVHTGLKRKYQEIGLFNNKASSLLENHQAHVQKDLILLYCMAFEKISSCGNILLTLIQDFYGFLRENNYVHK